jgi:cytochrome oxidase assembly protein ShyY1
MWRLLRKPRWIFLLVLAVGLGSLFIRLGFWQWHKHQVRDAANAAALAGQRAGPVPLDTVLPAGTDDHGTAAGKIVSLSGTYDIAHDLPVYGRTRNGQPGDEVITPLVLPDGRIIIINRGWIPFQVDPDLSVSRPPTGQVSIVGVLEPTETSGTSLPGDLTQVTFIDLGELSSWIDRPVLPYWVHLQSQTPAQARFPEIKGLPPLDAGPYFSYALQWWFFAFVAFAGFPLVLYREARDRRRQAERRGEDPVEGMSADTERF